MKRKLKNLRDRKYLAEKYNLIDIIGVLSLDE
jgi:hypothetical protein